MKRLTFLLLIGFSFLSFSQEVSGEKVLDRSAKFPRWAKGGYSRGKVFKQKKGSKNTKLCDKKGKALWFLTTYETQESLKFKNGKTYNLPLDKAQRLATADKAAKLSELLGTEIETRVQDILEIVDMEPSMVQAVANDLQAKANVSNFITIGSAWERIAKGGETHWRIYSWSTICKSDYKELLQQTILASNLGVSEEQAGQLADAVDSTRDEYEDE